MAISSNFVRSRAGWSTTFWRVIGCYDDCRENCAYAAFTLALEIALAFLCFTPGAVIFWRRSDDWMALLGGLAVVGSIALNGNVFSMDMSSVWGWIAMGMYVFAGGLYLLVLSLSAGRFVTRWAPWLLLCWVIAVIHFFVFMNYVYSLVWSAALVLEMVHT